MKKINTTSCRKELSQISFDDSADTKKISSIALRIATSAQTFAFNEYMQTKTKASLLRYLDAKKKRNIIFKQLNK